MFLQYFPRNMHTVFALLCFVVVIHWLIFPYLSGLLHCHCGNLTIAPVPAKQPWWIWISTSCEFNINDCITTTKQSTTKPCAYFLGYTVLRQVKPWHFCRLNVPKAVYSAKQMWAFYPSSIHWVKQLLCEIMYSISQEMCTRFCCALLCCGYAIIHNEFTWSIYPYS